MQEVFKDIENYEGLYQVSNTGKVKSLINNIILKTTKRTAAQTYYEYVTLVKDKIKTTKTVHRLVANAFISNENSKPCVNHIDNNGLNNNVSNLEWCTYSENLVHAQKQGRLYNAQSKGGKVTSEKATDAAECDAKTMVTKVFGKWQVVELIGMQLVGTKGIMRHKFRCKCIKCGNTKVLDRAYLKTEPGCRKCDAVNKTSIRYKQVKDSIINTIVNNWKILEVTLPISTIRTCKLHAECVKCGNKTYIPYATWSSNKSIKTCKNCDG